MKKFIICFCLMVVTGCVTDGRSHNSKDRVETERQYLARTKYNNTLKDYVLSSEGIDLTACANKPKKEAIKIVEPLRFKEVMNFVTFSSHAFGHPVMGKWEENIDLRPCGHNRNLKMIVRANNGENPIFETVSR